MRHINIGSFAFFVFACASNYLNAQDAGHSVEPAQQPRIGSETRGPETQNYKVLIQHVEHLTSRAAALRAEGSFADAAEVDNEIRRACFENDPRLIRANQLKRRASDSLLDGNNLDADMYNREADRILQELENEFFGDDETPDESRIRSAPTSGRKKGFQKSTSSNDNCNSLLPNYRPLKIASVCLPFGTRALL